jgi:hypothetical protein
MNERPTVMELLLDEMIAGYVMEIYESHLDCISGEKTRELKEKENSLKKREDILEKLEDDLKKKRRGINNGVYIFFLLGRYIDVTSAKQKTKILTTLEEISTRTKEECICALEESTMRYKILNVLPLNDKNKFNFEVGIEVINLLVAIVSKLFDVDSNKEEQLNFELQFSECDGYDTLLFLLSVYKDTLLRLKIACVLGKFYSHVVIPEEGKIIINILINYLKEKNSSECAFRSYNENLVLLDILKSLICISLNNENIKILLDAGIISLLFHFFNTSKLKKSLINFITLLSNICNVTSIEDKNRIINSGLFDFFHEKLLEMSSSKEMVWEKREFVNCIVKGIKELLVSNFTFVTSFLKTPAVLPLLSTLKSAISLGTKTFDDDIGEIQANICNCFLECTYHSYEDICCLFKNNVVDSMMNIIEMYLNNIKERKMMLREDVVEGAVIVIFNVLVEGSNPGSPDEEGNKFKKYFDENNRFNVLVDLFKLLITQPQPPTKEEIINYISISICLLLKREKPPPFCGSVIEYIYNLKSSPSRTFGFNFPSIAQNAWNNMTNADEFFSLFNV